MRYLTVAHLRGVLLVCGLLAMMTAAALAQTFADPGFTAETVVTLPIYQPVGLTWAPDGRMFVWQESGLVRIVKNGVLLTTPFLNISSHVNNLNDRGMLGVALDPNFAVNGYIYLLYVYEDGGNPSASGPKTIRVTRMQADPANPDVALPNSEVVILGSISTPGCANLPDGSDCIANNSDSHSAGTLRFAPDGKLFVSIGDGASYDNPDVLAFRAQNLNRYEGKILRINPDGSAPGDNPFDDGTNSARSKIYAYGLRNPYRFALSPTGEPYIGDVGWGSYEEQNRGRGANFGWPCYEGQSPSAYQTAFTNCQGLSASAITFGLYTYSRGNGAATIGGTFYTAQVFPAQYRGNYFFADYVQGWIRRMILDANNNVSSVVDFATSVTDLVSLELGPDGALYYISLSTGQVRRIRSANAPPVAAVTATPTSGYSPLTVNFSSNGSVDPGGLQLGYLWEFGDGAASTSTSPNPTFTYTASGVQTFTAKLTVTNTQNASASSTVKLTVGSRPPTASISAPSDGARFNAGETVTFQGAATDPDEILSSSALSWNVLLHHDDHIHPYFIATGPQGSFVTVDHGGGVYYWEIILTATDSSGLTSTTRVNVYPIPSSGALPTPWVEQDVGDVTQAGSATYTGGTFTVRGNGRDIWGTDDAFHFVYRTLTGDGQITARVATVQNTFQWAKAGVMIRESLISDSRNALMAVTPGAGTTFQSRPNPGDITAETLGGGFAAPYWVRLVRSGSTFSGYQSSDGVTWTLVGSQTISLASSVYVGLAVTSTNTAALCAATFDNVTVSGSGGGGNVPPTVNLTAPSSGASFTAPANITLNATASDSDGTINRVEFYQGATLIGTTTTATNGVYSFAWNNVAAGNYTLTARAYDNANAPTTSNSVAVTVNSVGGGGSNGLRGEYYDNIDFTALRLTRTDATVNFNWGRGAPATGIGADTFSVRWTGQVQPQFSETYTFYTTSDDGVRLWVNGQLIIDNWTDHSAVENSGTITLVAGQRYDIRLEYYDRTGNATIRLSWSSLSRAKQIIPQSRLFTP